MDRYPLGGSIPFVAFDTTELLSEGICADNVEFLTPCSKTSALRDSQSYFRSFDTSSSTSFLYVSIGRIPFPYLVLFEYSHAPFSFARLTVDLIR